MKIEDVVWLSSSVQHEHLRACFGVLMSGPHATVAGEEAVQV